MGIFRNQSSGRPMLPRSLITRAISNLRCQSFNALTTAKLQSEMSTGSGTRGRGGGVALAFVSLREGSTSDPLCHMYDCDSFSSRSRPGFHFYNVTRVSVTKNVFVDAAPKALVAQKG